MKYIPEQIFLNKIFKINFLEHMQYLL